MATNLLARSESLNLSADPGSGWMSAPPTPSGCCTIQTHPSETAFQTSTLNHKTKVIPMQVRDLIEKLEAMCPSDEVEVMATTKMLVGSKKVFAIIDEVHRENAWVSSQGGMTGKVCVAIHVSGNQLHA